MTALAVLDGQRAVAQTVAELLVLIGRARLLQNDLVAVIAAHVHGACRPVDLDARHIALDAAAADGIGLRLGIARSAEAEEGQVAVIDQRENQRTHQDERQKGKQDNF